jgi:hypothetical protein
VTEELKIYVGSRVRIFGEWHQPSDLTKIPDKNDPFADPTTLLLRVHRPDGTVQEFVYQTDIEVIRDSQGKYHVEYLVSQGGPHSWAWLPTGNAAQPSTGEFFAHSI